MIPLGQIAAALTPRCPSCGRGPRVVADYALQGVTRVDGYCGQCGKNWPAPPRPVLVPVEREA